MKTINKQQSKEGNNLQEFRSDQQTNRPKIGDDDGISNRTMNILLVVFMLMTMGLSIGVSEAAGDDVKYRILLRQAMLDMDRMNYEDAIQKLLEVQRNTDENQNVSYLLGMCYLNGMDSAEKAAFYLNKAAVNVSDDYESWDLDEKRAPTRALYQLAKAYEQLGEFAKASEFYGQYLVTMATKEGIERSKMYALIKRSAEECQLAAMNSGQLNTVPENIVLNK